MKTCSNPNCPHPQPMPLDMFNVKISTPFRLHARCKTCHYELGDKRIRLRKRAQGLMHSRQPDGTRKWVPKSTQRRRRVWKTDEQFQRMIEAQREPGSCGP